MNYLPFCGYWFYGAANSTQTAAFFSSWGLLATAPGAAVSAIACISYYLRMFMW